MKNCILFILFAFSLVFAEADPAPIQMKDLPLAEDKGVDSLFFTIEKRAAGDALWRTRKLSYTQLIDWATEDLQDSLATYFETKNLQDNREYTISASTRTLQQVLLDTEITDSLYVRNYKVVARDDTVYRSVVLKSNMKVTFAPDCKFTFQKDTTWSAAYCLFNIDSLENVILDFSLADIDGALDTSGVWNMYEAAVKIRKGRNIIINGLKASNFAGDGIYIVSSDGVIVENTILNCFHPGKFDASGNRTTSDSYYLGRNGISLVANSGDYCQNIFLKNLRITNGAPAALDIEPNAGGVIRNVSGSDFIFDTELTGVAAIDEGEAPYGLNMYAISGGLIENVNFTNIKISGKTDYGLHAGGNVQNVNIANCLIDSCYVGALVDAQGINFNQLTISNSESQGFWAYNNAKYIRVNGFQIFLNGENGFDLHGASTQSLSHIFLANGEVYNNNANDNSMSGIFAQYVDTLDVFNVKMYSNADSIVQQKWAATFNYCDFIRVANNWTWGHYNNNLNFVSCTDVAKYNNYINGTLQGAYSAGNGIIVSGLEIINAYNLSNALPHYAASYRLTDTYLVNQTLYSNKRSVSLNLWGGNSYNNGSYIQLFGDEHATSPGRTTFGYGSYSKDLSDGAYYYLQANDNGVKTNAIVGYNDGQIKLGSGSSTAAGYVLRSDGSGFSDWYLDDDIPESGDFGAGADLESDGSVAWENATGLNSDGSIATGAVAWSDLATAAQTEAQKDVRVWSIVIDSSMISTSADISFFYTAKEIVVDTLCIVQSGGSTPSLKVDIHHGSNRSASGSALITTTAASTDTTTGHKLTSFNNGTIAPGSFVWIEFDAVTSKPRECMINLIEVD